MRFCLRIVFPVLCIMMFFAAKAQTNNWAWMKGDRRSAMSPEYGSKGVTSVYNDAGARTGFASWKDASGNFWVFGGYSDYMSGRLNDLWKYDPTSNQWTWINGDTVKNKSGVYGTQGVASASNYPGSRMNSVTWADALGNLWLFGGYGYASGGSPGYLADLWKYNIATNQWTWVKGSIGVNSAANYNTSQGVPGSNNIPGSAENAAGWVDGSGNLWMFGGTGYNFSAFQSGRLNMLWKFNPSTSEWTWYKGDQGVDQVGVYGTQGTPAAGNKPGSRRYATSWADASGNLWLFGGNGIGASGDGALNDLWKYNIASGQWTWMKGDNTVGQASVYGTVTVFAATNKPGGREGSTGWIDASGNLWLYGGGNSGTYYSDLWKYNNSTNQWAWMKGDNVANQAASYGTLGVASAGNKPSARYTAGSMIDGSGNLWLFGGYGYPFGFDKFNDIWKYNPSTNQWAWVNGDNQLARSPVYGTQGVSSTLNNPGARSYASSWTDASNNLWLFGGQAYDANLSIGYANDLWKYSAGTGQWTWIKGSSSMQQSGVYGTQGTAAAGNNPGSRNQSVTWVDASGNLWLFGGFGFDVTGNFGLLNDLWKYNISTNQWTWIKGDNSANQTGVYGTKGVAASTNKPGARYSANAWADASGNLWLGFGFGTSFRFNDLWKYNIASNQWTWMKGDNLTSQQASVFGTKGVSAATNKPGSRNGAVSWVDASGNFWLFGGSGTGINTNGFDAQNDLWKYNPSTNEWTWMSGDQAVGQGGVFGTKGIPSVNNTPGARAVACTASDSQGNLWLFGGNGYAQGNWQTSSKNSLNDLWRYNTGTGEWTWVKGDNSFYQTGVYGTLAVAASTNKPGSRENASSWSDASGNFWIMGGIGYAVTAGGLYGASEGKQYLNDLWKYDMLVPAPGINSFTPSTACSGSTVTITGTNLSAATAVKFGGTDAASFTVVNATTITAVVGAGASGSVTVTTGGGTASLSGFTLSNLSVSLINTGGTCIPSAILSVTGASSASQIVWNNNGSPVSTVTSGFSQNGTVAAGGNGQGSALNQLNFPNNIFIDASGNLFVADGNFNSSSASRILKFPAGSTSATNGVIVAGTGTQGSALNQFGYDNKVFVDGTGSIYVGDNYNLRVLKFPSNSSAGTNGAIIAGGNGSGSGLNQFSTIDGIFVDSNGNLFVADGGNARVIKFSAGSTQSTNGSVVAQSGLSAFGVKSVYVTGDGSIYVADATQNRVLRFPSNSTSATAGTIVAGGNGNGAAQNQLGSNIGAIYVDEAGTIYIPDVNNHRIQKWLASAVTGTTVAGGSGIGSAANQLAFPKGVWLYANSLYVSDGNNNRIQKYLPEISTVYTPANAGTYTAVVSTSVGCSATTNSIVLASCPTYSTLNLKLFLEGFYAGNGLMRSNLYDLGLNINSTATDSITVNLWLPVNLPNSSPDYSARALLSNDGTAIVQFPATAIGNSYYVAIRHRNHLETWSKLPVLFAANTIYDFSDAISKAYDDGVNPPMKQVDAGRFAFYGGDISLDGGIDGQDMNYVDNEVGFYGYNNSDVNGDGATDGQDMNYIDNNSQLGLFFARPY